jgi:hypothetical protein
VILFALIALEKFAQTSENKQEICKYFARQRQNGRRDALGELEQWIIDNATSNRTYLQQEIAFCVQWALDNLCK